MTRKIDTIKTKVDADTGEVLSTSVCTSEQDEGFKQKLTAEADYEAYGHNIRKLNDELGGFTWLLYNSGKMLDLGLQPDELTKVIFLSTFMDYDNYLTTGGDGKEKVRIGRIETSALLLIGERKLRDFWRNVKTAGVLIEDPESGLIRLNNEIFHKGSLDGIDPDKKAIRIYAKAVRKLYDKSTAREHKLLSKVYQAIPYVNIKYNMLCTNPEEEKLERIRCMCLTDYCRIIGYDIKHIPQFRNALKRLTVTGEYVFGFTETGAGDSIFINPRVYYGGNNYDEVRVLGEFFREKGEDAV